ncbi:class I SAM-dependent methyltransferase [Streptomyces sp. BBFR2]|uniref:class I SAM-dependent methyltransferase n=1 Tax=Streptomyces sp. BBFR2 TaxID=3372854 RepID=UPI0037DA4C1B
MPGVPGAQLPAPAVPAQQGAPAAPAAADRPAAPVVRPSVRQELLGRQIEEQIAGRFPVGQRLRVLDAGTGDGVQALRLARAGHHVTALEQDPGALEGVRAALAAEPDGIRERVRLVEGDGRDTGAHFLPGSFDVVLCHGLLSGARDPDAHLAGLARVLAPGGLLSLVVRNTGAAAMRPGLAGDWHGVLAAFEAPEGERGAARSGLDALTASLAGIGAPLQEWYGVGVFTDASADAAPQVPAQGGADGARRRELLLSAEERAGRTDPYRTVAGLLHLCGVRGG